MLLLDGIRAAGDYERAVKQATFSTRQFITSASIFFRLSSLVFSSKVIGKMLLLLVVTLVQVLASCEAFLLKLNHTITHVVTGANGSASGK